MKTTRNRYSGVLGLLLAFGLAGCRSERQYRTYNVDGERALALVAEIVDIGPRPSASPGAQRTVEYLAGKCREFGYEPVIDEWTEETSVGSKTFRNVYAELPGHGAKFVVVGSHYDTKLLADAPLFAGANDSGSSTGLLLEIMRMLKQQPWDGPPLRFAFFDGEECVQKYSDNDGLHGSRRLVGRLRTSKEIKHCRAMVLLDMIGDRDLRVTISPTDDEKLAAAVMAIAREQGVQQHFGYHRRTITDDHTPFKKAGIPAVDLIDFDYGPNNSYWHTGADALDKLSADSLTVVGNVTIRLLQTLRP